MALSKEMLKQWTCIDVHGLPNVFSDLNQLNTPIKHTIFFTSVTVHKNMVHLIGNIEYLLTRAEIHQMFDIS